MEMGARFRGTVSEEHKLRKRRCSRPPPWARLIKGRTEEEQLEKGQKGVECVGAEIQESKVARFSK